MSDFEYRFYTDQANEKSQQVIQYATMSRNFMNGQFSSGEMIVGNFGWHQVFPYEKYLLEGFDIQPGQLALDFGCGPGRMIPRMSKFFERVDGVDLSSYALSLAKERCPDSKFYLSSGMDVGDAPKDTYDFIYSTIAIQHIPCHTIRTNIFKGLWNTLKSGGKISVQMAYVPNITITETSHSSYDWDFFEASATNGLSDVVITEKDIPSVEVDFRKMFGDVRIKLVPLEYNLNGQTHSPYWATHWIFIYGTK